MKISVFGLGYVGCVSAACFAKNGHSVLGVDIQQDKVDMLNRGKSPILEKGVEDIIFDSVGSNRLKATLDAEEAIISTDISLICVGTPSNQNGSLNTYHLINVVKQIGEILRKTEGYHVVVIRSTVLPGTLDGIAEILEDTSKKQLSVDFGLACNPEFLREGTAIHDFYNPPYTVIGSSDERTGGMVEELYEGIRAPVFRTGIKVAEMIKYANNVFHALKITFANEIGTLCKEFGMDSYELMDMFCKDDKLNLSSAYLKPGFAFGGSCLPKDVRALCYEAKKSDLETPVLQSIIRSNDAHINRLIELIRGMGRRRIGFLGISFKEGTDDLRESPIVEVIERLVGKGFNIRIYDRNVSLAYLVGTNKEYIERVIPHISSLMLDDPLKLISNVEVVVVANKENEYKDAIQRIKRGQILIDLVRMVTDPSEIKGEYIGICW